MLISSVKKVCENSSLLQSLDRFLRLPQQKLRAVGRNNYKVFKNRLLLSGISRSGYLIFRESVIKMCVQKWVEIVS